MWSNFEFQFRVVAVVDQDEYNGLFQFCFNVIPEDCLIVLVDKGTAIDCVVDYGQSGESPFISTIEELRNYKMRLAVFNGQNPRMFIQELSLQIRNSVEMLSFGFPASFFKRSVLIYEQSDEIMDKIVGNSFEKLFDLISKTVLALDVEEQVLNSTNFRRQMSLQKSKIPVSYVFFYLVRIGVLQVQSCCYQDYALNARGIDYKICSTKIMEAREYIIQNKLFPSLPNRNEFLLESMPKGVLTKTKDCFSIQLPAPIIPADHNFTTEMKVFQAQKKDFLFETTNYNSFLFQSTVRIQEKVYKSGECRSKTQARNNASKVALILEGILGLTGRACYAARNVKNETVELFTLSSVEQNVQKLNLICEKGGIPLPVFICREQNKIHSCSLNFNNKQFSTTGHESRAKAKEEIAIQLLNILNLI